jgi:transcriptional regulator with XRE-family HTH domain
MDRVSYAIDPKIIGQNVRKHRKERKLTQVQLANLVGLTQEEVSYYETGVREPTIQTLVRLAIGLKTSSDSLLGLDFQSEKN